MDERGGQEFDTEDIQRDINEYLQQIRPPPEEVLKMEYVFEALAHPRRRYLIYSLLSSTEWTLRELATKLVAWERDLNEETVTDVDRDEMFASLHHAHIPKLVDHGVIEYHNGEEGIIVAAENAVQVLAALEGLGASVDTDQEAHARSAYSGE